MAMNCWIATIVALFTFGLPTNAKKQFFDESNVVKDITENRVFDKFKSLNVTEDEQWPVNKSLNSLGQVAGIAATNEGTLYVFHRGDRVWDQTSFDLFDVYQQRGKGPIDQDAVLILNSTTGNLISSWGKNFFYMPHGISIDPEGNVWLTDVALHQVFRFKKGSWDEPDLTVGEAFVPGTDGQHFCKPTDVAISSSGIVYVSDGYCNQRILILDAKGKVIRQIANTDNLWVPHSLTLLENDDLICVADREHSRVLCYTAGLTEVEPGELVFTIPVSGPIYAIDRYDHILFGVTGPSRRSQPKGFALQLVTENEMATWSPKGSFKMPHDLTVCQKNKAVFVTEIGSNAPKK
ncbi:peptidyl-alpha-hydroxyglycine alpha-amidating lyase 2-like protein, partial [Leptotrombidium deliense]